MFMNRKPPLPRGLRNNNPGNLERTTDRWKGMSQSQPDDRFITFESMAYGYRALFMVIRTYIRRYGLDTIPLILKRYAPHNENNTDRYIKSVLRQMGASEGTKIDYRDECQMKTLARAITRVENGRAWFDSDVDEGWDMYLYDITH